jgi:para-nitrobenzyl esterase
MTRYQKLSATLLLLSATAFAGVAFAAPGGIPGPNPNAPGQNKANGPTVSTTDGPVQGFVENGVNKFLGIPYAAPPVGNLRWMPPQPPAHHAKLDATAFGNTCPQVTELGAFAGPSSTTEDCLYLNVFTTSTGGSKPVLVWIHGGGNVDGETNDYDASKLAKNGVVVVTLNYRMGLFGFISEDHLNGEGHPWGNYGIMDQQMVLHWVQANIANFGGDPTTVALGGQSAGSQDTAANMVSPAASGLFSRAILHSPVPGYSPIFAAFLPASNALANGNAFAAAAGCSDSACLRGLSAARILQLQGTPNANGPYVTGPNVDGTVIPISAEQAWETGAYTHMPIMGGSTKDELTFLSSITEYFSGPPQHPLTPTEYVASINGLFGANGPAVLAEYPLSDYGGDTMEAYNRATTDGAIKCPSLQVLHQQVLHNGGQPVYGWDFTYQNAPYYFPQMPNDKSPTGYFQPLAAHTIDIQFLFDNWHGGNLGVNISQDAVSPQNNQPRELQGQEIGLSDTLVAAWTNFVKTGDPNGTGVPTWAVFDPATGPFLEENLISAAESVSAYETNYKCAFWAGLYPPS